jgi:hypothetical protein
VVDHLPVYGPDGGAVAVTRAGGVVWPLVIAAAGVAIVVLGGILLT